MRLTAAVQQHWGWSIIMPFYCNHQEGVTTPPFDNVPSTKNVSEKLWQEGRETQEDAGDIKSIHHLKFFISLTTHCWKIIKKKTHFAKFYVPTRGEQIRLFTFLADRAELTLTSPQLWLLLKITKVIFASAGNRTRDRWGVKLERYLYAIVLHL